MNRSPRTATVCLALLLCGSASVGSADGPAGSIPDETEYVWTMRQIHTIELGIPNPAGLTYSPRSELFYVVNAAPETRILQNGTITAMSPFADRAGSVSLPDPIPDPLNLTFDSRTSRFLLLGEGGRRIVAFRSGLAGRDSHASSEGFELSRFGITEPAGLAFDAVSGSLFILDGSAPRILRVTPPAGGSTTDALDLARGRFAWIDLSRTGDSGFRGVAFHPGNGNLYVLNPDSKKLYEITPSGEPESVYDLSSVELVDPRALVIAPSGDPTDDPATMNLYIADTGRGGPTGHGHVYEVSLEPLPQIAAAATTFNASLVRTIATSAFSPPSPDAMSITYNPVTNRLIETDSEVEEMSIYAGVNVFEMSLSGTLARTYRTSFSNEPTGISINTTNGHWIFSDDDIYRVFDVSLGSDGLFGTSDDSVTSFSTTSLGDHDPEDLVYDRVHNHLFLADGVGAEIWDVSPGPNGRFDGVPPSGDDSVTHFDTLALGLVCPEGIGFNPDSGTLYLSSRGARFILETTTTGTVVNTIDTSPVPDSRPSGLVYAPSSTNPSVMHLYIADRGADNCSDPNENDGKIFEITLPAPAVAVNQAPSVGAGLDQSIVLPALANLQGTASDDGLPAPPSLTTTWSKVSGPGAVTFGNSHALATTAGFSAAGVYVLRLTASDGALGANDDVGITVGGTVEGSGGNDRRIATSSDDAEESASGSMSLTSSDLELVHDSTDQRVGLRFPALAIPQGAAITSAYVQFQTDEAQSEPTSLTIQAQKIDSAPTFTSSSANISSRARTTASITWSPAAWTSVGEAGANQKTPSLSAIIQEIVSRPGWTSGNAIALIFTGTGHRTAVAYDGIPGGAPLLHVEFSSGAANQPPSVNAGGDQTITLPASASLGGTASDDGLPAPPSLTTTWSKLTGPGSVTFGNIHALATTASFSAAGAYVLRLTADDTASTRTDDVAITVNPAAVGGQSLDLRVSAGSDDAEQRSSSTLLTSSDLELVYDGQIQVIGIRFVGASIPRGATITGSYIQFQVDEAQSEATTLTIQAQSVDSAPTFTTAGGNVSSRARTLASAVWSPGPWTSVGQTGPGQRTPDLSPLIQEVVNRPGWASGGAIAFIVTGTGHRTAVAYDGIPAAAPLLHVEFH